MNKTIKKIYGLLKNPKLLIIMGACGVVLLIFSGGFGSQEETEVKSNQDTLELTENYRENLEESVLKIVKGISGDKNATVVVTLESGIRYDYADSYNETSSNSSNEKSKNESSSSSKTYLTFKNDEGGEAPLVVTEIMPEVRGVAIVCTGGDNEALAEKIKNAVTAALDITSKRVYIVGGNSYEKR